MNIPLINSLNIDDINTSLIAIRKNMQKTSSGTEKLQDVDVNVNIAHNSLYCAADSTVIKGASLFQGCSIKIMFTSAITGSDTSTPLVINYNDANIPVKTGKNGTLADFVAYDTGSGFVYCQAYTTLELLFDGTEFVIMGNPVVISNSDYTVYTDGTKSVRNLIASWSKLALSLNTKYYFHKDVSTDGGDKIKWIKVLLSSHTAAGDNTVIGEYDLKLTYASSSSTTEKGINSIFIQGGYRGSASSTGKNFDMCGNWGVMSFGWDSGGIYFNKNNVSQLSAVMITCISPYGIEYKM